MLTVGLRERTTASEDDGFGRKGGFDEPPPIKL